MKKKIETSHKYLMECHVAGVKYHDADEVWNQLKIGTPLVLCREEDNGYDPEAVALAYVSTIDSKNEEYEYIKIGYIPSCQNTMLATFLDMGWDDAFECRLSKVDPEAPSERQLRVTIKVRRR